MAMSNHMVRTNAGRPIRLTTIRLLSLPSDTRMTNVAASARNCFSLSGRGPKGCLLGMSFVKCIAGVVPIRLATGIPTGGVKGVRLTASTIVLRRTIIMTRTPRIAIMRSALVCGSDTCHAPRKTVLRRLIGGLPNTRVSSSNGIGVGNGSLGGVVISNGRFFNKSIGANLGGLPMSVISGLGACSGGSSLTHIAKVSSNRRRAMLSLAIGGKVGRK